MGDQVRIGMIAGTGVYKLPGIQDLEEKKIETPYGITTINLGWLGNKRIAFLTRHGADHHISPGQINARANLYAMKSLGVRQLLATACSASADIRYGPGSFVLIDQFIEFTKNRPASFFYNDGENRKIYHMDMTKPYCETLGNYIVEAGESLGISVHKGATYACTEGPRFETSAEVQMFKTLGATLIGHTQYPEVALARECEMCYAAIGIVANMAAGICDEHVAAKEINAAMSGIFDSVQNLLASTIKAIPENRDCWCQHARQEC